jgi:NADH:ubiquinone reductase (non-electrogenic)
MASSKLGLRLAPRACAGFSLNASVSASIASRRALSSLAATSTKPSTPPTFKHQQRLRCAILPRSTLQLAFRRSYASEAPEARLSPPAKPKKRFRILRWLWRITYLSALGSLGYVGYQIWYLRNPTEQFEPDPKKKTLVILGMWCQRS